MNKQKFVDISHWQGEPAMSSAKFDALKKCGVKAVIMKATQGTSWVDVSFFANLKRARNKGFLVGVYHFADGSDGKAQAKHFLSTVRKANGGNLKDLLLVMDVERNPGSGGNPKASTVRGFAKQVQSVAKRNVFLCYTAAGYWYAIGNPDLKHLFDGLWQARWDGKRHTCKATNLPSVPPRAGFGGWNGNPRFWQYGMFKGSWGSMDGNAFYGSLKTMTALFKTEEAVKPDPVPPPPPDPEAWRNEYNEFLESANLAVSGLSPGESGSLEAKSDVLAMLETLEIEG